MGPVEMIAHVYLNTHDHGPSRHKERPTEDPKHLGYHRLIFFRHLNHLVKVMPSSADHPNDTKIITDLTTALFIKNSPFVNL